MSSDYLHLIIDAHAHKISPTTNQHRTALAGTTHRNSLELLRQYSTYSEIFVGYGLHPWFVSSHEESRQDINVEKFDFIGEIGLDRGKRGGDFDKQCVIFKYMIGVAQEYEKSICVHVVRSYGHTYKYLRKCTSSIYFHGYQGSMEFLSQFPESFIGIGMKNIKHAKMQDLYKNISLSRVLLETDGLSTYDELWNLYKEFSCLRNVPIQDILEHQQSNFNRWISGCSR